MKLFPICRAFPLSAALLLAAQGCHTSGGAVPVDTVSDEPVETDSPSDTNPDTDTGESQFPQGVGEVYLTPYDPEPGGSVTIYYSGKYADQPELYLRYGFNGWNQVTGLDVEPEIIESKSDNEYRYEVPMEKLNGGFRATIDLPDDGRSLHFVFFFGEEELDTAPPDTGRPHPDTGKPDPKSEQKSATDAQKAQSIDDNDGWEYHYGILFPYIGPYLSWDDQTSPQSGVVVSFESGISCTGTVEYGTTEELGSSVSGEQESYIHNIRLTGLDPDTLYYYRVSDSNGRSSGTYQFRTAPEDIPGFTFGVMSDMQDNGDDLRWGDVAAELQANHPDIDFFILPGDMPYLDEPGHWWTFFDKGRALLASRVVMPTVGNHDTPTGASNSDTSHFQEYFALPPGMGSETTYRFDYGPATFLALNSEVPEEFVEKHQQYQWMQGQLQSIGYGDERSRAWVFAYWHIPPYNAGFRHGNQQTDYRQITSLFEGAVDWVFCGHEHLAHRFVPLRYQSVQAPSGEYGTGDMDGVGYLVTPPAGTDPSVKLIDPEVAMAYVRDLVAYPVFSDEDLTTTSENGFVKVSIAGSTMDIQIWGMGNDIVPEDPEIVEHLEYDRESKELRRPPAPLPGMR